MKQVLKFALIWVSAWIIIFIGMPLGISSIVSYHGSQRFNVGDCISKISKQESWEWDGDIVIVLEKGRNNYHTATWNEWKTNKWENSPQSLSFVNSVFFKKVQCPSK